MLPLPKARRPEKFKTGLRSIGSKRRAVGPSRSRKEMSVNFPQGCNGGECSARALIEQIGSYALDPLGFVLFAFPWASPESHSPTQLGLANGIVNC